MRCRSSRGTRRSTARATPRAGCARRSARASVTRRQPGLVVRRDRLAVVLEAGRVHDPQLHAHRCDPLPGQRLGAGEVAPGDRLGGQRAGALEPLHLGGQVGHQVAERAVLELGAHPAEQPLRLVLEAGPLARRLEVVEALLGAVEREDHRPREQPVEQQELRGAALGLQAAVGAQERLVGAARAQRAWSTARRCRRTAPRSRPAGRSCRRARCSGRASGSASPRRGSSSRRRCR